MKWFGKYLPSIVVLLLTFLFLNILLPDLIYHPGEILLAKSGDGLKSYYVINYHLNYDNSFLHFSGMNYPYGDNYLFSDGFPAITFFIQTLPFLKPFAFQIIHGSILLSLLITPLIVFLILRKYKVRVWFAIIGALALFSLQPQFPRLFGHLSLSYSCFFPLAWYLLLRFNESLNKWLWTGIIFFNSLFWFFIHGYLGFMIALYYLTYFVIKSLKREQIIRKSIPVFIFTFLPLLFFFLFSKYSDNIKDRPENPFGFFDYQAHWKSIFLPNSGFLHDKLALFINFEKVTWEGSAYIGTTTLLVLFFLFTLSVAKRINRKSNLLILPIPSDLIVAFFSGSAILIYAFGFPFNQIPDLLKFLAPIKQFRALGRFSWPFYYVSGILAVVTINQLMSWFAVSKTKQVISVVLVVLVCSLYFFDSYSFLHYISKSSGKEQMGRNVFSPKELTQEEKDLIEYIEKNKSQYQAILPLPWFHIGSEMYGKEPSEKTLWNSFILSSHTGMPIYAMLMGRTSISQTEAYFRSFAPREWHKKQSNLFNKKDFLIWFNGDALYLEDEQIVYDNSKLVYKNSLGELRSISQKNFFGAEKKENVDKKNPVFHENFSNKQKWRVNSNNGRYRGRIQDFNIIAKLDSTVLKPNQRYEVEFEYFWAGEKSLNNVLIMEHINSKNEVLWFYSRPICSFPIQLKNKVLVKAIIQTQATHCKYNIFLNARADEVEFEVDNLFVRPL